MIKKIILACLISLIFALFASAIIYVVFDMQQRILNIGTCISKGYDDVKVIGVDVFCSKTNLILLYLLK